MSIFEKLEPRILLSADLLPVPAESLTEPLGFDNTPPLDQPEAVDSSPAALAPPSPAPEDPDSLEATPAVLSNEEPDPQAASSAAPVVADPDGQQPAEDENSVENSAIASGEAIAAPEEATDTSGEATTVPEEATTAEHTVLPAEPTGTSEDGDTSTTEIIFVNDDIEDPDQLLEGLSQYHDESHVFILDSSIDGITQVSDILADYDQIDAVHFFTHGTEGNIKIGSDWLNKESVAPHSDQISSWNDSLRDNGDLLFYGCDVAATPEGREFLADIAELTSADIAASTDTTGHHAQGGDWILEYQLGEIETSVPLPAHLQESWQHIMAAETVGDDFNTVAYNNNSGTVNWLGDWTEVGDDADPSAGNIFIDANRLQVKTAISSDPQRAISRGADLSSAASAFISFDYEQQIIKEGHIGAVELQIRADASDPWVTIGYYTINGDLTASELIEITPYISSTTQIQFSSTGNDNPDGLSKGEDNFYVDNLRIDFNTNVAPTASNLSLTESYTEDTPKEIADIVINDSDGGRLYTATLTISDTAAGSFNTASVGSANSNFSSGVLTVTGTNLADVNTLLAGVIFSPTLNYNSNFTIATSVSDGIAVPLTGIRTMNAIAVNDGPQLGNNDLAISEGGSVVLLSSDLSATDVDNIDSTLVFSATGLSGGRFELTTAPGVAITSFTQADISDGVIRFVHDGGETAPAYEITVSDSSLTDGPAAAAINFTNINDAPLLVNNQLSISENGTVVLAGTNLQAGDPDNSDAELIFLASNVSGGQFELTGAPGTAILSFTQEQINNNEIQFVHDGGESGPSFDISVSDPTDGSGPAAAVITYTPVNDAPALQNNALTIGQGQTVAISSANLLTSDPDNGPGALTYTISDVTAGQFELATVPGGAIFSFTQLQVNNGDILFVHDNSLTAPAYKVEVSDIEPLTDGPEPAMIAFNSSNVAPVLGNNSLSIAEGGNVILAATDLSAADVDNNDATLVFSVTDLSGGHFELTSNPSVPITSFNQANIANGEVRFVHDGGEAAPFYRITVSDGVLSEGPSPAAISFSSSNDAPLLGNNTLSIAEGDTVILDNTIISATDIDSDDTLLQFTVSHISGGKFTTIADTATEITSFTQAQVSAGQIQFIHDGNETGPAYRVSVGDGALSSAPAPATIIFNNLNDAPLLVNNELTISEGGTKVLSAAELSATDTDNIAGTLVFTVSSVTGGTFERVSDPGTTIASFDQSEVLSDVIRFIHDGGEAPPSYHVTVSDGSLTTAPADAVLTFTNTNDNPILLNNGLTIGEGGSVVLLSSDLSAIDIDNEDSTLVFSASGLSGGHFELITAPGIAITSFTQALVTGGLIQFIHNGGETAPAYTITVSDSSLVDGPAAAAINFTNTNDAPTASKLSLTESYTEDTPKDIADIVINDVDGSSLYRATLTLSDTAAGTFNSASVGSASSSFSSGVLTVTGTNLADVNTLLAGVTFTPTLNYNSDFAIATSVTDGDSAPITGIRTMNAIAVGDTPAVNSISTDAGVMTGNIFVLPNPSDGPEVTHFQIINITNGSLFQQDGITPILNNDFITLAQGSDGLKFLPYSGANGSFAVQSSENGSTVAAQSDVAISVISINASEGGPAVIDPVVEEPEVPGEPAGEDDTGEVAIDEVDLDEVDTGEDNPQPEISPVDITLEIATGQPGPEINPTEPEIDLTEPAASSAESAGETQEETAPSAEPYAAAPTLVAEFYHTTSVAESLAGNLLQNANLLSTNLDFRNFALTASFLNESNEFTANDSILADGDKTVSPMQPAEDTLLNLYFRQRMNLEYDYIKSSLDAFREETQHEGVFGRTVVGSAIAASTSLSAGYVIWLLRSGALISSLLSSLPAWQFTDPLAILAGRHREDEEQDEDDSLESIVAGKQKDKDKPVG